jgi:Mrp family chromosome partitioning ATPase
MSKPQAFHLHTHSTFRYTFAIMSSKGGVGKSTITTLLASHLTRHGWTVGILDADILGPSIGGMVGYSHPLYSEDGAIMPAITEQGIAFVSSQLLLGKKDEPMVYRAPIVLDLIRQFYENTLWGKRDVLLIDLPPGTGDTPLTVLQQIPLSGIIMVTTPQEIVQDIVSKGINMLKLVPAPLVGIIENYAYFQCDSCQKKHTFFGEGNTNQLIEKYNVRLLASLPLDAHLPNLLDSGKIESCFVEPLDGWVQTWIKELSK